jgi:sugar lactone lactonase YvrE
VFSTVFFERMIRAGDESLRECSMRGRSMLVLGLGLCAAVNAGNRALPDVLIDDTNVYPESMSAAKDGTLYIGSIKGIIFRALPGSAKAEPWIQPSAENGVLSLLGVLTDERSGTLWICSSPNPFRNPPAVGTASLMAFDLRTGAQKGVYPFPAPASVCNDITVAHDGTVYVSDTPNGRILKLTRGAKNLEVFAQDDRLKGIDGLVLSGDETLYVNIVTRGLLMRVERKRDGSVGEIVQLTTSAPLAAPDGFRLVHGNTFLLAEGNGGRIDEVTIHGDQADIKMLRDGLISPPAVTLVGKTAYALEGKIGYLIDPKLKGQDPGPFIVHAVPLER